MSDWNWNGGDEQTSQVIPRVNALAVYSNANGDVVIRQQGDMGEDDRVIIFPANHADAVIGAIKFEVGQGELK